MTPKTHIHHHLRSWLRTGTTIKGGRVKLVLWAQSVNDAVMHFCPQVNITDRAVCCSEDPSPEHEHYS